AIVGLLDLQAPSIVERRHPMDPGGDEQHELGRRIVHDGRRAGTPRAPPPPPRHTWRSAIVSPGSNRRPPQPMREVNAALVASSRAAVLARSAETSSRSAWALLASFSAAALISTL